MRERIIFAPGLSGSEMSRSLALHGINLFNTRFCGAGELARLGLMRSGIQIDEDFLDARQENAIIARAVQGEPYFGKASYTDIRAIAGAVRRIRGLTAAENEGQVIEETLSRGIFTEKNAALLRVYQKYMDFIAEKHAVDAVSLIRKAIACCGVMDADFVTLEEFPLSPLEKALLTRLSGGKVSGRRIMDLFNISEKKVHVESYKKCYGAPNEVESVIADIYAGKRLDQCTVAVTDPSTYGQLFLDYALQYDIPVTFGCGIPILNANPAKLLVLYYNWLTSGFFGAEALQQMLSSDAFDRSVLRDQLSTENEDFRWDVFYEALGNLRLTDNMEVNERRAADFRKAVLEEEALYKDEDTKQSRAVHRKVLCIPCIEIMARELAMPAEDFIAKYAYIRKGSSAKTDPVLMALDMTAVNVISEELKVIRSSGIEQTTEDIIQGLLRQNICRQASQEGRLHITDVAGALSSVRDHLYIVGLSASIFPGSPKENHLLLDADLKLFGKEADYLKADERIREKRHLLLNLVRLASSLNSSIFVSYSGLNVSELKKDNASSLIFELYREEMGKAATAGALEEHLAAVDYFAPPVSLSTMIGRAYNDGKVIRQDLLEERKAGEGLTGDCSGISSLTFDREFSPTALETFFACPRKFLLGNVLRIPEAEKYNPFEIMTALERGNLAHALMRELGSSAPPLEDFLKLAGEYFDRFIEEKPPLIRENTEGIKDEFLEMMESAWQMDPRRDAVLEEEEIHCVHETGVKIHGYPDRVEKLDDGSCLIVDFKTGRRPSQVQDDPVSCLQVMLYAYMMEQKGFSVSGGEYRYLQLGDSVTCTYNEQVKKVIAQMLAQFKECMLCGDFPIPAEAGADADLCKYCTYAAICGRDAEMQENNPDEGA